MELPTLVSAMGKGLIEFFGTVCSPFTKWMDSYCRAHRVEKDLGEAQKDVK